MIRSNKFSESEIKKLLSYCSAKNMTHDIALAISDLQFEVEKELADMAWEILDEKEKYQLLLNQLLIYSVEEISNKLGTLGLEYQRLAGVSKEHKEYLPIDKFGYNKKLLEKLKEKDYITAYRINESIEVEPLTFQKKTKRDFEVCVKKHM